MRNACVVGRILPVLIFVSTIGRGQPANPVDSLLARGARFLADRNPDQAQKTFEKALKADEGRIDAMMGMASADIQRERWGKAADWFELVMKKAPDHVPANYGYAVSKREIGKFTGFVQRPGEWRKSEKYFRRVLALDSSFQDVLYQYALLKRYDEKYETAVDLALRQAAVHPDLVDARMGIFKLYDCLISDRPVDRAEAWLKSRPAFYDRYFLGELYRRNGRLDSADSLFTWLIPRRGLFPLQPLLLSRVRLLVQENESQQANDVYWQAVRAVSGELDAEFIKQDLIPIVNEEEYEPIRSRTPWPALSNALLPFWFRRDPLPSFPFNHRLIEHYRRMVYAEKNFRFDGIRNAVRNEEFAGYAGFHQNLPGGSMTRPIQTPPWYSENDVFNDMGLIYIRFGEPDNRISTPGQDLVENASWLYNEKAGTPKMIFHFIRNKPDYWILISGFSQTEILTNLADWDSRYYQALTGDEAEKITLLNEMKMERAQTAERGLRSDRLTWPKEMRPLDVTSSLFRFRQSGKSDLVQLAYGIPLDALKKQIGRNDSIPLETGVEAFDNHWGRVYRADHRFMLGDSSVSRVWKGLFIDEFQFEVPLQPVVLSFHARLAGTEILNGWRQSLTSVDTVRDRLACSTLKTAFDIKPARSPGERNRDALRMVPNPMNAAKLNDPLYIYYEIYNLRLNEKGNTNYTVHFTLRQTAGGKSLFRKMTGLFGGGAKFRVSIQNNQSGRTSVVSDYLGFDVRKATPGKYELKLTVTDRNGGKETSTAAIITLD
jgi:tetratricopeptide (TPR) repeat protein